MLNLKKYRKLYNTQAEVYKLPFIHSTKTLESLKIHCFTFVKNIQQKLQIGQFLVSTSLVQINIKLKNFASDETPRRYMYLLSQIVFY